MNPIGLALLQSLNHGRLVSRVWGGRLVKIHTAFFAVNLKGNWHEKQQAGTKVFALTGASNRHQGTTQRAITVVGYCCFNGYTGHSAARSTM